MGRNSWKTQVRGQFGTTLPSTPKTMLHGGGDDMKE